MLIPCQASGKLGIPGDFAVYINQDEQFSVVYSTLDEPVGDIACCRIDHDSFGWRLRGSNIAFETLSTLVHHQASPQYEAPRWHMPYDDEQLDSYAWYWDEQTLDEVKQLLVDEELPFVVRRTGDDQYALHFIANQHVIEEQIDSYRGQYYYRSSPVPQLPS